MTQPTHLHFIKFDLIWENYPCEHTHTHTQAGDDDSLEDASRRQVGAEEKENVITSSTFGIFFLLFFLHCFWQYFQPEILFRLISFDYPHKWQQQ